MVLRQGVVVGVVVVVVAPGEVPTGLTHLAK